MARLLVISLASAMFPGNASAGGDPQINAADSGGKPGQAGRSELAGTSWRLIKIMSMDDSEDIPEDPALYTLKFGTDGSVTILADCNRGIGSWTSKNQGQLQFGPIAATRALCRPESLSEKYLAQFDWVRSYVMNEGHMYLATMADGSIIEFAPEQAPLAATVLGEEVRTGDAAEMQRVVLTRLFERYASERGIEVSDSEIDAYVEHLRRAMAEDPNLTAEQELTQEEAVQVREMRRTMGRSMIHQWKINQELYHQYGGRIIFQQLGPEPLDAYRRFLEERHAAGDFKIHEAAMEETFWRYFTDDSMHVFMETDSEAEAQAFEKPPWE